MQLEIIETEKGRLAQQIESIKEMTLSQIKAALIDASWTSIDVKAHFRFLSEDYSHEKLHKLAKAYLGDLTGADRYLLSDPETALEVRAKLFHAMLNSAPKTDFVLDQLYLK